MQEKSKELINLNENTLMKQRLSARKKHMDVEGASNRPVKGDNKILMLADRHTEYSWKI